jgi:hypothetical protein
MDTIYDVFVVTVAMVTLLKEFGTYVIIFMVMCVYYFRFSRHP